MSTKLEKDLLKLLQKHKVNIDGNVEDLIKKIKPRPRRSRKERAELKKESQNMLLIL